MINVYYFFRDSEIRRSVVRGTLKCPGANYMLYGADQMPTMDFEIHHNLQDTTPPSIWITRLAWLADHAIKAVGGSSGDFQTVFKEWRRCRKDDIVVSTVDNVGVPLAILNYFGLLRRPLLYVSIGLPERIAPIKSAFIRALYRTLYRRVPRFVTYGWQEAFQLREWLGLPPDSNRVTFIPFAVDPLAFSPMPDTPVETQVLSVGADMMRDFHLLLSVAAELPAVTFKIITSPRHAASFNTVPANVRILTNVPFSEIRQHLAGAQLIVLPCHENTYSSGTTTLLQCMAMAKPIVVTRTGAIRDGYQLEDNVNCRLVAPGSNDDLKHAIQELLNDRPTQERIGAAARKTVEAHLTWAHYVQRMTVILNSLAPHTSK